MKQQPYEKISKKLQYVARALGVAAGWKVQSNMLKQMRNQ
jgi:hypothetical protein